MTKSAAKAGAVLASVIQAAGRKPETPKATKEEGEEAPSLSPRDTVLFRYRPINSPTGVTRAAARQLAEAMGMTETAMIHLALRNLHNQVFPVAELAQDDEPLTDADLAAIEAKQLPAKGVVLSSLID